MSFLTTQETDALIAAPDLTRWKGRRDRALLLLAVQTGLRVSALTGLNCADLTLGPGACIRCQGKGRKHRAVPLLGTTEAVLKVRLSERAGNRDEPLFPTRTGRRLSSDAVQRLVRKHATAAARHCPSILPDQLHPHVPGRPTRCWRFLEGLQLCRVLGRSPTRGAHRRNAAAPTTGCGSA